MPARNLSTSRARGLEGVVSRPGGGVMATRTVVKGRMSFTVPTVQLASLSVLITPALTARCAVMGKWIVANGVATRRTA